MLVTELIRRGAAYHGERTALLFGDERFTFRQVDRLSNRIANALGALGLAKGDAVTLLLDNGMHSVPCDFGAAKAGLVRTPLNGRLSLDEHRAMIEKIGAATMVYGPSQAERAAALKAALPGLAVYGLGDDDVGPDLLRLAANASDADPALVHSPDDVVLALFTSGTTGTLKAVQHTHASYCAVVHNVLTNLIDPAPGEIMLHAASLIHASGCFLLPYWLRGGVAAILPGFAPAPYIEAIERWRPSALNLVPTMLQMLFQTPEIDAADLSSVETIVYGASPMPRPVLERALALWGPVFVQYYGQTEAPIAICCLGKADHAEASPERLLSCGRPSVETEIKLIDEEGGDAAPGEAGEIVLRAPFVMKGYTDDALNEAAFLPGGWLRTRDVGRFDEEGYLTLVDRTSDMIVTGGYNVYPREVEDVLAACPAVAQAAVVGLPDDIWGEAVTAFVVLHRGAAADEGALIAHAHALLAGYKAPKSVRFVDSIPLSPVGKPLRRALREPFWQGKERADMSVRAERNGPVTTIVIDRPDRRNAVDPATAVALRDTFANFQADETAQVAVLTGAGGHFCAGFDLKAFAEAGADYDPLGEGPMGPTRRLLAKPVLAAVEGYAVAGGLELALWCDMRIASESATFGVFCRRWGVPLIDGGTVRLPRIVGQGRALDMILTGRPVGAEEALAFGLANRVVAQGQARAEAERLAAEIARFPALCMRTDRLSAYASWDAGLGEALRAEALAGEAPVREGAREGAARFADGRGRSGDFGDI